MGLPSVGDRVQFAKDGYQFVGEVERVFNVTGAVYVKTLNGSTELANADMEFRTVPGSEWTRLQGEKSDELKRSARLFISRELIPSLTGNPPDVPDVKEMIQSGQNIIMLIKDPSKKERFKK